VALFGGTDTNGTAKDETWEWDGSTWSEVVVAAPPLARTEASLVWDPWRRRLVMFGGRNAQTALNDTWEFDGISWTPISTATRPPTRERHVMFVTPRGLIVHGGNTLNGVWSDVWRLRWNSVELEETCTDGIDRDGDGRVGCDDDDCWMVCQPACAPGTSCVPDAPRCGDGQCGQVETCRSCPSDCGACNVCGDAGCDSGETQAMCPGDCTP
jgi:hypothetical protein